MEPMRDVFNNYQYCNNEQKSDKKLSHEQKEVKKINSTLIKKMPFHEIGSKVAVKRSQPANDPMEL